MPQWDVQVHVFTSVPLSHKCFQVLLQNTETVLGRAKLILDMYSAECLEASTYPGLRNSVSDEYRVYLPKSQKWSIFNQKRFDISNPYKPFRIFANQLRRVAPQSVMVFRPSMLDELQAAECLNNATLITSTWAGYSAKEERRLAEMDTLGIDRHHAHTSGHATVAELKRFINAFPDSKIVPIHLEDREGFMGLSPNVTLKNDGEWWDV
jgi:ribonuclease J